MYRIEYKTEEQSHIRFDCTDKSKENSQTNNFTDAYSTLL